MSLIKRGWEVIRKNAQAILAVSAFGVSLCALYVSIVEIRNNQEFQRISVWPRIWVAKSFYNSKFRIHAINQGLGPAVIRSIKVTVDGIRIYRWSEAKDRIGIPHETNVIYSSISTRVMAAGEEVFLLEATDETARFALNRAWEEGRIRIEITYSSVYGECWRTNSDMTLQELETCPHEKAPGVL